MKRLIFVLLLALAPLSVLAKDYGPFIYGTSGTWQDTITVSAVRAQLAGTNLANWYLWCKKTTDLAAPMNQACRILKHTASSGAMYLDTTGNASMGFSAALTSGDELWLTPSQPAGALIRDALSATKIATGVAELNYMLYLTQAADDADSTGDANQVAIVDIREDANDVDSTADNLVAAMVDVESDADTIEVRVQSIDEHTDTEVADIDSTANNLVLAMTDVESDVDTIEVRVQNIDAHTDTEIADIDSSVNNARATITLIEDDAADVDSTADNLVLAMTDVESDVDTIEVRIQNIDAHTDTEIADIDSSVNNAILALSDIESDADTIEVRIQNIDAHTDTEIADIDSSVNNARATITLIEDDAADVDSTADNLVLAMTDVESDVDTIEVRVQNIDAHTDTEVADIDSTTNNNRAAIARLEAAEQWNPPLRVDVNHVSADSIWSSVGTHEVINMPDGVVTEFWLTIRDSIAQQGADSLIVEMGATKVVATLKNDWDGDEFLTFPTDLSAYRVVNPAAGAVFILEADGTDGNVVLHGLSYGVDIGYEVQTSTSVNAGYSIWTLRSRHLDGAAASAPIAGLGGAL